MNQEPLPAQGPVDVDVSGEPQEVAIRVTLQGAVRVNAAHLHKASDGIAAVYVDLHSKRAELACTGSGDDEPPSVTLLANDNTLYIDETQPKDAPTTFEFPDYVGWRVFAAGGPGRYTLAICLVAPEAPNGEVIVASRISCEASSADGATSTVVLERDLRRTE